MRRLWKTKLPAFLLAMVMVIGMVPAASAARADISYDVDAGKYITIDDSDFSDYFDDETTSRSESLDYLEFTSADDFDDYGYFYAYDKDGDRVQVDYDDLLDGVFYVDEDDVDGRDEYELSGLRFYADKDAESETLSFTFKCRGDERSSCTGYLEISVEGSDSSGSSSGDIVLEVDADDEETVSAKSFKSFFDKKSDETFTYMYFYNIPSKLDNYGYFYSRNKNNKETSLDADDLKDAEFYYDSDDVTSTDEYTLTDLTFVADEDADGETVKLPFYAIGDEGEKVKGTLTIEIGKVKSSSKKGDVTYTVAPSKEVEFDEDDFYDYLDEEYGKTLKYVLFTDVDDLRSSTGYVYYRYGTRSEVDFEDELDDYYFYYDDEDNVPSKADEDEIYPLDYLSFVASKNFTGSVTLEFRAYYSDTSYKTGTLVINSSSSSTTTAKGDITVKLKPGAEEEFDPDDFNDCFQKKYSSYDFKYLVFTDSENLTSTNGDVYYNYGRSSSKKFTASTLESAKFYYDEDDISSSEKNAYPLEDISFVAASTFSKAVTLEFRAYYSTSRYVDGTMVINPDGVSTSTVNYYVGNIRYSTTPGTNVQINANDIARFFSKMCPGYTMQYVLLTGVPSAGSLYYNYYNTSKYGTSSRAQITSYNASGQVFYASPTSTSQYALTELTYVPSGSNYCAAIPFTAYGTGTRAVSGAILISVTSSAVAEVYGVTPKNTAVNFPTSSIYSAVLSATGSSLSSIQLLNLPSYTAGVVYAGSNLANTTTQYTYSGSGTTSMSQLRFVPTTGYTGSVEIPYVALNSSGTAIASGTFSLGVVNSVKKFSDVTSSTWCYKYVAELSDAGVISGYSDGSFKPNDTVTYGAALKLIMLAAGYPEQKPTGSNVFSGYLDKARADGIITSSNVDLSKRITRLQVAQLAAGALKLDTSNLSSVQPFTDTTDASVRALNAAGIVEGYFSNGTSTFKPNNTLTRGQVSAIVWRMQNYRK